MIKNIIRKTLALLVLGGSGMAAYCQDGADKLEQLSLKELLNVKVTTASKTLQDLGVVPASIILITREQIKNRGYQSLLDVMYDLPDVKVDDKIYSGMRNTFTIRGTQGEEKLVILIDGISISSPSGEAMPIMENYPVNLAEQIEIVFGPASALYGANAVSGVINIITRKPVQDKGLNIEGSSVAGNYGYTNSTFFISNKINEHVSFMASGQYSYDKGVDYSKLYKDDPSLSVATYAGGTLNTIYGPMTPNKPVRPNYEAPLSAFNLYAGLRIDDFSFTFFMNHFTIPTAYGSNTSNTLYNKDAFMTQRISMGNISYKKVFDKVTTNTSMTASEYYLDPRSNYRNLFTGMEPAYKYSSCSMLKAEEQMDFRSSEKLDITAGAGYESYNSIPQSADLAGPVNPNDYIHQSYVGTEAYYRPEGLPAQFYFIRYHNIGTYLQAKYSPVRKVHITLGARYDVNSRYGTTFNPRLGIVFEPTTRTTIKLLYGSAFIAPQTSDSYAQYGSFETPDSGRTYHSVFLHLPNPGLKPIKSFNSEINLRQYLSDNIILTVDAYYTVLTGLHSTADDNASTHLYNNMFDRIPVDYVEVFVNRNRQENYGGSLELSWKHAFGRFQMNTTASVSYVNGIISNAVKESDETQKDTRLEFISPYIFHLTTDLKLGRFSCSPRLVIISRQNISGNADTSGTVVKKQTIPGYALLNVSLRYNVAKRFSVFANVSNALNQHYRSVSFNMDLEKNTDGFHGQREDPIRIMGGFSFNF
ncbi:MAG TPA: TonB-dependent receptor [Puia sp.]|nr:TonB-dependent receptor [Puia sp.]